MECLTFPTDKYMLSERNKKNSYWNVFCSCTIRISTIQFWSAREPFKAIIFTVHPSVLSQNNHKANYSETNRFSIIVNEIIKLFGSVWNIILNIQIDLETFIRKLGAKLKYIFAMRCQCSFLGKNRWWKIEKIENEDVWYINT